MKKRAAGLRLDRPPLGPFYHTGQGPDSARPSSSANFAGNDPIAAALVTRCALLGMSGGRRPSEGGGGHVAGGAG